MVLSKTTTQYTRYIHCVLNYMYRLLLYLSPTSVSCVYVLVCLPPLLLLSVYCILTCWTTTTPVSRSGSLICRDIVRMPYLLAREREGGGGAVGEWELYKGPSALYTFTSSTGFSLYLTNPGWSQSALNWDPYAYTECALIAWFSQKINHPWFNLHQICVHRYRQHTIVSMCVLDSLRSDQWPPPMHMGFL